VNQTNYGEIQSNIEKTMEVLKRRGTEDPELIRKKQALGINPMSDIRLAELMQGDKMSPEKELQRLEDQRKQQEGLGQDAFARTPYNDTRQATSGVIEYMEKAQYDGSKYLPPYQRAD